MTVTASVSHLLRTVGLAHPGGVMREWSPHSYEKISILADYLPAFARASGGALQRVYIDAFAGETMNVLREVGTPFPGSAELALRVDPPFTQIRLFETHRSRVAALRALAPGRPGVEVIEGDCNVEMSRVLAGLPVQAPTFAFLDPDGMDLHWSTIEVLAAHKGRGGRAKARTKVEMWVLCPTSSFGRLLGSNRNFAEAQRFPDRVARLYGARGPWEAVWDARLDGRITPREARQAYLFLYMDRLVDLGYQYVLVRPIENSKGELYSMIFATDHPAGDRIMRWAAERDRVRPRPGTLFDVAEPRPAYEDLHTGWRDEFPIDLPPWIPLDDGGPHG